MMLLIHVCHCDAALTGTHPDNGGNVHDILRLLMEELGDLVLQLEGSLIIIGMNDGISGNGFGRIGVLDSF